MILSRKRKRIDSSQTGPCELVLRSCLNHHLVLIHSYGANVFSVFTDRGTDWVFSGKQHLRGEKAALPGDGAVAAVDDDGGGTVPEQTLPGGSSEAAPGSCKPHSVCHAGTGRPAFGPQPGTLTRGRRMQGKRTG